jgi:hypothetical protein
VLLNPWTCALLISGAGAVGGIINALLTDNGFILPKRVRGIWCPGFLSTVLVGAAAAVTSWAFYGAGAGVELTDLSPRNAISLRFSALAGALLVGVAGAKWLTNEAEKTLLKQGIRVAAGKAVSSEDCERILEGPARQVLKGLEEA